MQGKTGFDRPIFDFVSPFFSKVEWYHKYSKSFIENIPLPASYAIRIYWNVFNLESEFFIDYSDFFGSVMKDCVFIFEKDSLFTRN